MWLTNDGQKKPPLTRNGGAQLPGVREITPGGNPLQERPYSSQFHQKREKSVSQLCIGTQA
ncbi:MAG: hypothetical protein MnENMB40S_22340 [Rhizobiaceae bacterium MnEN-MB40S]|nr:MAG: hypothetical protein MnENMB40S_22340 [Rhizobiaceae bacterium MnEN-MB40S]